MYTSRTLAALAEAEGQRSGAVDPGFAAKMRERAQPTKRLVKVPSHVQLHRARELHKAGFTPRKPKVDMNPTMTIRGGRQFVSREHPAHPEHPSHAAYLFHGGVARHGERV